MSSCKHRSFIVALTALLALPALAAAQTRVGVANTARIFNEMQETRDLQQQIDQERVKMEETVRQKRGQLQALREARDQIKPDSPQYQERNRELLNATVEFETWGRLMQAELQRTQKRRMASLFEKIESSVAVIAQQKGLELVLAQHAVDLPPDLDELPIEQVRAIINQRNVLYATDPIDVTDEVLAHLDAQYKGGQ